MCNPSSEKYHCSCNYSKGRRHTKNVVHASDAHPWVVQLFFLAFDGRHDFKSCREQLVRHLLWAIDGPTLCTQQLYSCCIIYRSKQMSWCKYLKMLFTKSGNMIRKKKEKEKPFERLPSRSCLRCSLSSSSSRARNLLKEILSLSHSFASCCARISHSPFFLFKSGRSCAWAEKLPTFLV